MAKTVFLFAGQGSQVPGMGHDLYEAVPAARAVFDAAERLRPGTLRQCFEGTAEELAITINTQPCLFAMDLACAEALRAAGVEADAAAGFSLGEIAALAFTGILGFDDAFRLVCRRAELMQAASEANPGAMDAILRLDAETVERLASKYDCVFPVNYNCPGQTVVSGVPEQLAAFEADVAAARGRAVRLKVGGAFHSPFMEEASRGLAEYMTQLSFAAPRIPLYANTNAEPYGDAASLLAQQVKTPVRWQRTIERLLADGYQNFIEVGAGKTLTGFLGKIGGAALALNVENRETLAAALSAVKE